MDPLASSSSIAAATPRDEPTTSRATHSAPPAHTKRSSAATMADTPASNVGVWSTEEHERYLQAKYANPKASWKEIARLVGTRSARQVILHDQKFRAKMERRRSKSERAKMPAASSASPHEELRYFDSMGVLLLASVASSRTTPAPAPHEEQVDSISNDGAFRPAILRPRKDQP